MMDSINSKLKSLVSLVLAQGPYFSTTQLDLEGQCVFAIITTGKIHSFILFIVNSCQWAGAMGLCTAALTICAYQSVGICGFSECAG